jgi:hypothetical protein
MCHHGVHQHPPWPCVAALRAHAELAQAGIAAPASAFCPQDSSLRAVCLHRSSIAAHASGEAPACQPDAHTSCALPACPQPRSHPQQQHQPPTSPLEASEAPAQQPQPPPQQHHWPLVAPRLQPAPLASAAAQVQAARLPAVPHLSPLEGPAAQQQQTQQQRPASLPLALERPAAQQQRARKQQQAAPLQEVEGCSPLARRHRLQRAAQAPAPALCLVLQPAPALQVGCTQLCLWEQHRAG